MADIELLPDLDPEIQLFCDSYEKDPGAFNKTDLWGDLSHKNLNAFKKSVKQHYIKHQDYRCIYCRQKIVVSHGASWDLEHIVPKKIKPLWMLKLKNLCVVCRDCNIEKGEKNTLINSKLVNIPLDPNKFCIYNPHVHTYAEHITVVSEGELYLPLTEIGRKTIDYCGFSRFLLKLSGVGVKSSSNALLMMKIVDKMTDEEDDDTFKKLNGFIGVISKSNKNIIEKRSDEAAAEALQKLLN